MFVNKVLRKIFLPKKDEVSSLGYCIMRNVMIYMGHLLLLG